MSEYDIVLMVLWVSLIICCHFKPYEIPLFIRELPKPPKYPRDDNFAKDADTWLDAMEKFIEEMNEIDKKEK